jgi:hypothetical protein
VKLHQDATMSVTILESGEKLLHRLTGGRCAWLQVEAYPRKQPDFEGTDPGPASGNGEPRHHADCAQLSVSTHDRSESSAPYLQHLRNLICITPRAAWLG